MILVGALQAPRKLFRSLFLTGGEYWGPKRMWQTTYWSWNCIRNIHICSSASGNFYYVPDTYENSRYSVISSSRLALVI